MSYQVTAADKDALLLTAEQSETVRAVLRNIATILSTPKGTVPMYREFGIDTEPLDLPLPIAKVRMVANIREAVEQWEPRARVTGISFRQEDGKLIPTVEVEIYSE